MGVYRVDFLGWIGRDNWHTQSSASSGYGVPRGETPCPLCSDPLACSLRPLRPRACVGSGIVSGGTAKVVIVLACGCGERENGRSALTRTLRLYCSRMSDSRVSAAGLRVL